MEKLNRITELCKCSVSLTYREDSNYYETLKENIKSDKDRAQFLDGELDKCLETDQYWCLRFYPNTPVSFYRAYSSDLNKLLDWGLEILEDLKGEKK